MIALALVALTTSVSGSLIAHKQYDWLATQARSLPSIPTGATDSDGPNEEPARTEPIDFGSFYEVENLIVNPAESGGSRYLMVNVGFESNREAVITEIDDKEVVVRDRVINLLSKFTVATLADINQRAFVKDTLRHSVNEVLEEGEVTRLYFTQYVLQ